MTFLLYFAAFVVAILPALGCAILAVTFTPGFGPDARDRAGKLAVTAFVIVWVLSAWGLIEWWV